VLLLGKIGALFRRVSQLEQTAFSHRIRISDDVRYLTIGQVKRRYGGVSDMWVWRYMRQHGFPKPVQFGGPTSARHWLVADLEQWERERSKSAEQSRRIATS
jgi:predicted DNA-binding transcriptional regulator AlpA